MAQLSYAILNNMEAKQALYTYVQCSLSFVFLCLKELILCVLSSLLYKVLTTHKRMLCDKFCWYWHTGSGEETTIRYFTSNQMIPFSTFS